MKFRLKHKIAGIGLLAAILPVLVILALSISQRKEASRLIKNSMQDMISEELNDIVRDFYSLCRTANDFTQQYVNHSLNIAREKLYQKGLVKLLPQKVTWQSINQFSRKEIKIFLPKMTVGGKWLGQNLDLNVNTAVVDDVKHLLGATCTVFQRMNKQGNMLRVATNVETLDKKRAIGTFIPAINPDGKNNPVISSVINGKTFHGRAYVVNDWYLTAYEPIRDSKGQIIGMLYVGVKQESAESFRESVLKTTVGKSGYLYAVGGNSSQKGQYIISKDGLKDGEFIWDEKDANGEYFVQDIVEKAMSLSKGEIAQKIYSRYENGIERKLITRFVYFEPWDWVIGANAYEEDFLETTDNVDNIISGLVTQTIFWVLIILVLVILLSLYLSSKLANPLIQMTSNAQALAAGDMSKEIKYSKNDEVGQLADSYNKMARDIHDQREELQKANKQLTEVNATKDKFFSIIAHDLKNPFNTILTSSKALVSMFEKLDKDRLKKGIETLHRSANRGYNLLVDLLTWARSQSDQIEYLWDNINLGEIAEENVELALDRAKEKGIKVSSNISKDVTVWSDKNMVSTVMRNFLSNAVKFTSKGGEVSIDCEQQDKFFKVTVKDTGVGIEDGNIKKLFRIDTFYRTLGSENEQGTGLGLILCKEFIDKLGGNIWVESEPGKGSCFIFTLPSSPEN